METGSSPPRSRRERFRRRISRLRPDHVPAGYRAWIIACWAVSLGVAAVILIPSLTDAVSAEGTGAIARFTAPVGFRVAVAIACSALAGASVVWVLLRHRMQRPPRARDAVLREAVIIAVAVFPVAALLADGQRRFAAVAAVPSVALLVLAHLPRVRTRTLAGPLLGVVAALSWLPLAGYQLTAPAARSESWVWVALFGAAAALAAFGSYYGVARAAETRSSRLTFLYRADLHPVLVLGIVLGGAAVAALRLTVARDLFPSPDPELWTPFGRSPISWTIAFVVASMIVIVAVRASQDPLTRFGERRIVAVLAGIGNLELAISAVVITIGIGVAVVTGATFLPTEWLVWVPLAKLLGVLVLGLVVLLPSFRGTAARWIALPTVVFLAATTLSTTLVTGGVLLQDPLAGFPATPVQVAILLLAAAFALCVWNLVIPRGEINPSLVVRLAIVPLIAVHAGWLLPAAWSGLGRIVVVVTVLLALAWFMPPVAADRMRHGFHVLSASVAQLLTVVVFLLAIPSLFADGALTVLGLLWLSVPIIAALTIDTKELAGEAAASQ
jgi:hypothetical protein